MAWARRVNNFDEIQTPGDYVVTDTKNETTGQIEFTGVVLMCKCGTPISLQTPIHTFENITLLTIFPSIIHVEDNQQKCHYFIKNGEYVPA